ncbi:hypothetical protein [Actinokineospora sp.]|uniref:hypothetical protein n=1 Tax=Actinokineospora sp. TaxID=1872133 RepID=UPI0040384DF1
MNISVIDALASNKPACCAKCPMPQGVPFVLGDLEQLVTLTTQVKRAIEENELTPALADDFAATCSVNAETCEWIAAHSRTITPAKTVRKWP